MISFTGALLCMIRMKHFNAWYVLNILVKVISLLPFFTKSKTDTSQIISDGRLPSEYAAWGVKAVSTGRDVYLISRPNVSWSELHILHYKCTNKTCTWRPMQRRVDRRSAVTLMMPLSDGYNCQVCTSLISIISCLFYEYLKIWKHFTSRTLFSVFLYR